MLVSIRKLKCRCRTVLWVPGFRRCCEPSSLVCSALCTFLFRGRVLLLERNLYHRHAGVRENVGMFSCESFGMYHSNHAVRVVFVISRKHAVAGDGRLLRGRIVY